MFLFKLVFWLVTLPIRLALFAAGIGLWVLTLPLRIVFGILGIIGLGRIIQLGVVGAVGYFFYKLVNEEQSSASELLSTPSPTEEDLDRVPST